MPDPEVPHAGSLRDPGFGRVRTRRFAGPAVHAERMIRPVRVAHLTDLHVGRITPLRVQMEAVRVTNDAEPDVVVITGDFVCHSQKYLEDLRSVVGAIKAPVACVLGNHDHWSGAEDVTRALERAGAVVLRNANTVVDVNGEALQIVGVDDAYTGHADVARATRGMRPDLPTLGLSHIGEEADQLWACGVPLVLSGHTHAGHFTFAKLHERAFGRVAGHKYVHGLYGRRRGEGAVYVGAGIGASVMPLRVGARAQREVTLFELGAAPGAFVEDHDEQPALPGRKPSERTRLARALAVEKKRIDRARDAEFPSEE